MSHGAVASAAAIGVPDDKWGEAVKAFVVLKSGANVGFEALHAHVKEKRGGPWAPKSIEFVAQIASPASARSTAKRCARLIGRDARAGWHERKPQGAARGVRRRPLERSLASRTAARAAAAPHACEAAFLPSAACAAASRAIGMRNGEHDT